jgi:hypothetical protein
MNESDLVKFVLLLLRHEQETGELAEVLQSEMDVLDSDVQLGDGPLTESVRTFEEAGVLGSNGLVVRTACGREFQVTVVRSR